MLHEHPFFLILTVFFCKILANYIMIIYALIKFYGKLMHNELIQGIAGMIIGSLMISDNLL